MSTLAFHMHNHNPFGKWQHIDAQTHRYTYIYVYAHKYHIILGIVFSFELDICGDVDVDDC